MVILTNGAVNKPLKVYDGYDARSEIEIPESANSGKRSKKRMVTNLLSLIRIDMLSLMLTKFLFFVAAMSSCRPVYQKKLPKMIYCENIAYKWNDL